jgi:hypothetical protein
LASQSKALAFRVVLNPNLDKGVTVPAGGRPLIPEENTSMVFAVSIHTGDVIRSN